jgi:hypothetical protein
MVGENELDLGPPEIRDALPLGDGHFDVRVFVVDNIGAQLNPFPQGLSRGSKRAG